VLDLNGLLVERVSKAKATPEDKAQLKTKKGPIRLPGHYLCWTRPHYQDFLEFIFEHFDVLVWSSAQMKNVEALVNAIMPQFKDRLVDKFDQTHCTTAGKHPDTQFRPLFIKELRQVWDKHSHYSHETTLLVDDSKFKAVLNPKHTAIHPKEWTRHHKTCRELAKGGTLRKFLEELALASKQPDFPGVPHFVSSSNFQTGYSPKELLRENEIASIALDRIKSGIRD